VDTNWTDTIGYLSDDAVWYALLRREAPRSEYGKIAGFVQSRYLRTRR
jgi:hypothetical protein